jgi:hypothetical protein
VIQAGYGAFKDLQYHQLKMLPKNSGCPWTDNPANICANPVKTNPVSGAEGGDSGSPFFYYDGSEPVLIGIYWGGSGIWHLANRVSDLIRTISEITGKPLRN